MVKEKIFIPFQKGSNFYFDEIINYSNYEFVFNDFKSYKSSYKVVNIHWPEGFFNWVEPTIDQLIALENEIFKWKKNSKIIYTVHNLNPHAGITVNFTRLYEIVEQSCDVFMHLGEFSKNLFEKKYPKAKHIIIKHPLYETTFKVYNKAYARQELDINKKALVIIAPGSIRKLEEKKLILKAFKAIERNNKILISTNMLKEEISLDFPGYYKLKKVIDIKSILEKLLIKRYEKPKYIFNYGFLENSKFALMMSASDIVLIPRIEILNSGLLFLGLTYNKIIIGPKEGNVSEFLKMFNFPVFNPKSFKSVKRSIKFAVANFDNNEPIIDNEILKQFYPKNITLEYDHMIQELISNAPKNHY